MSWLKLVVFIYSYLNFKISYTVRRCEFEERILNYYKIRVCYRSTISMIARTRTSSLQECIRFARQRKGLALNFSPNEAASHRNFSQNCQILGCPETKNSLTLVADAAFDYYSAYGNWNMTENATCIKSIGLFGLIEEKHNYTSATEKCQSIGADLANVLSEVRTNRLSKYINDTLQDWYKVAYIGLNDIQEEGHFTTSSGAMLSCFRYRAWAPGHPRSKHRDEDCAVLDSGRMWRVVRCKRKLPALCEFYPGEPLKENNAKCDEISDESE